MRTELNIYAENRNCPTVVQIEELIEAGGGVDEDDACLGYWEPPVPGFRDLIDLFKEDHHTDNYILTIADKPFEGSIFFKFVRHTNQYDVTSWKIDLPVVLAGWRLCIEYFNKYALVEEGDETKELYVHLLSK